MSIQTLLEKTREKTVSTVRYKGYPMREKLRNDAGELLVPGFFTDDQEDEMGDIITQVATEKAVDRWRMWGNIRTMHEYPSGKVVKIGAGDGLGWNEIVTRPVESKTIELLEGEVLQAYSVGIIPLEYEINEAALPEDEEDWTFWQWIFPPIIIHDYDMVEISYVDIPANPRAVIAEIETQENALELLTNRVFAPRGQSATVFKALGQSPLYKGLEAESIKEEDMSKKLDLQEPAVEEELEPVVEEEEIVEEETPDPLHELMLGLTDAVKNLTETLEKRFDSIELMLTPEEEDEPVEDLPVHAQEVVVEDEEPEEAKGLTTEDVAGMINKAVSESEERVTKVIGDKLAELARPTERRAILEPEPPEDEVEEEDGINISQTSLTVARPNGARLGAVTIAINVDKLK